jgi:hypothetical protein
MPIPVFRLKAEDLQANVSFVNRSLPTKTDTSSACSGEVHFSSAREIQGGLSGFYFPGRGDLGNIYGFLAIDFNFKLNAFHRRPYSWCNMKILIIALLYVLSSFICLGGKKGPQAPVKQPDYLAALEKGIHEAECPKITRDQWFSKQIDLLKESNPKSQFEPISFTTFHPTNNVSCSDKYAYCASRDGYHFFSETNWIILVTCNFHQDPWFDAVLLMDQNREFYTIQTHPCGNLEVYSYKELKMDRLENLLKTISRDGNKWVKYECADAFPFTEKITNWEKVEEIA